MCAVQANLLMAWAQVLSRVLTAEGVSAHSLQRVPLYAAPTLADRFGRLGKVRYWEIPAQTPQTVWRWH